jgi:hypothetical protein
MERGDTQYPFSSRPTSGHVRAYHSIFRLSAPVNSVFDSYAPRLDTEIFMSPNPSSKSGLDQ